MPSRYKKNRVHIFSTLDSLNAFAFEKWIEVLEYAILKRGRFAVALSGGKTPIDLYKRLAGSKKPLPWNKTHIFIVDERFVPFEHDQSNFLMIDQTLLSQIKIPEENIHPVSTEENSPENSALKYEQDLTSFFKLKPGEFPKFDLILLGIGEDGHTASLFPDSELLSETRRMAVQVSHADTLINERITLTLPVINNSKNIIFLASGSGKSAVLKDIVENSDSALPSALVKPKEGKLFFLLDEGAGSLLTKP